MADTTPAAVEHTEALKGVRVFIVEDDPMISEVMLKALAKSGCELNSTDNGSKAIALAQEFKPNVIILDLMLPGLSGERVLLDLKEDAALKDIPVIVFSNRSEDSDIAKVKALGAVEFFVKVSTSVEELIRAIQKHTQKA